MVPYFELFIEHYYGKVKESFSVNEFLGKIYCAYK